MSNELLTMDTHPDYADYKAEIKKVRDCVEGSTRIKACAYTYLPHPSNIDTTTDFAKQRYREFIAGAEFDGQPADTLQTLIGKMQLKNATVELPDSVNYLVDDIDGDGTSIVGAVEYAASNVIQAKFHVVVADYNGLTDADINELSLADRQQLNLRAKVKQYTRENVIDWNFSKVNGKTQLSYLLLLERVTDFDQATQTRDEIESYLVLALDENGQYYQRKLLRGAQVDEGEVSYITVNGQPLNFIPAEIVADQENAINEMPKGSGFLSKICDASLHKYEVSAYHKEAIRNLAATIMTKGWKRGDMDLFKEINGGREYLATGGMQVNNLPNNVEYDILSAGGAVEPFQWYFTYIDKKILSMGGSAKQEMSNMTATEADINASEQNAKLRTIRDNLESCFTRLVNYCMMFEGALPMDSVFAKNDAVNINLPSDFETPKLSVDEVRVIIEMVTVGLKTREQAVTMLSQGGWDYQDAELTILELEDGMTNMTQFDNNVSQP